MKQQFFIMMIALLLFNNQAFSMNSPESKNTKRALKSIMPSKDKQKITEEALQILHSSTEETNAPTLLAESKQILASMKQDMRTMEEGLQENKIDQKNYERALSTIQAEYTAYQKWAINNEMHYQILIAKQYAEI